MVVQNERDLTGLLTVGRLVGLTIQTMGEAICPGMTTRELDALGEAFFKGRGGVSAPQLVYKFPGATCISINDEAAHGIPGDRVIQAGDLVNIDVSLELDGYIADAGATFAVPPVSAANQHLIDTTRAALAAALDAVTAGKPINVIGQAVERVSKPAGLNIIRDLGGHGVGRKLHEEPRNVPNYFTKRARTILTEGLVMTVEPFLTAGTGKIYTADDKWTLKTESGAPAAQYEHTVIITKGKPVLVTAV